jgi:hypothetical protein
VTLGVREGQELFQILLGFEGVGSKLIQRPQRVGLLVSLHQKHPLVLAARA